MTICEMCKREFDVVTTKYSEKLRPATPVDIVIDAVIWYPKDGDGDDGFWCIVEEVLRPDYLFKAFSAEDGCRYGLDGAYIEMKSSTQI